MASVDNRIVKMEFDNASFERKLSTTLDSLGQLDKALKFTGATKGFEDINAAAGKVSFDSIITGVEDVGKRIGNVFTRFGDLDKSMKFNGAINGLGEVTAAAGKVNFNPIAEGIEGISKKFLALSTVALTVLSNITTQALHAGENIVKGFTLTPIVDGFHEYETQLNSVQTILANTASKGTTLDQVNDALQLLNVYSDQTIYNFGQMAKNIGTFTAAGVGLDDSVAAIKGIANLAAMSGSTADQASSAMYQLSQAMASGSLKAQDWISVVNSGMAGEAFQTALFDTAKALKTVQGIPIDQTFNQWKESGGNFKDMMSDGVFTAEVLGLALQGFTGDLTEEMLIQKGFTQDQATNITKTAAIAKAAATEVKTFTQLMGTVKEAVGTGFADSFKIIIGNFTEAKALWTGVNKSIGDFVQNSSDARNQILQGWKDFGARTALIDALKSAFHTLGEVMSTIHDAFREIFPATTAADLIRLTASFRDFITEMIPSVETIGHIKSIFQGLFAVLSIGWEIIKEGTKFFFNLAKSLVGLVAGDAVDTFAKIGDGLTNLQDALVKGGAIKDFFEALTGFVEKPIKALGKFKDALGNVFGLFDGSVAEAVNGSIETFGTKFAGLKDILAKAGDIWLPFENALMKIVDLLDSVWETIRDWFHRLGDKIADAMGTETFGNVLKAINTGLLAGIAALLAKFIRSGFSFDIGGGFMDKLSETLEKLTGVLSAMQTSIKAQALLRIAAAIAILTASVVVLSLINAEDLSRALTAMAVGFGQLIATFTLLTSKKFSVGPKEAIELALMAGAFIALAAAMVILSVAVKIFSTMSWEEIAKGLTGVAGGLAILTAAMHLMPKGPSLVFTAGALILVSAALIVLGLAMKIFATMSWEEIGKGMASVAAGLGIIAGAMHLMPSGPSMILESVGLIAVGIALNILAAAVKIFATMEWEELGKGFAAVAAGLLIIAGAMQLMPISLPITAAGLILVGIALGEIAAALLLFAGLSWDEIGRGLAGMAGALAALALALNAMSGTLGGAAALVVASVGLGMLFVVIKKFAGISWDDLLHGLGAMAISLGAIAGVALLIEPAVPVILALGAALVVLALGIALIGGGIYLLAQGMKTIAGMADEFSDNLAGILVGIGKAMPALLTGLAEGIVSMLKVFTDAAPLFAKALGEFLEEMIKVIGKLLPKLGEVIRTLVEEIFKIIRSYGAEYIKTGLFILTKLLEGLRDNIGPITKMVADILINFLKAMEDKVDEVAQQLADTLIAMYTAAAEAVGEVAGTLLFGIGIAFMTGFFNGLQQSLGPVVGFFTGLAGKVLEWIGDVLGTLLNKGIDLITGLWNGLQNAIGAVTTFFNNIGTDVVTWIGDALEFLKQKGRDIIQGLWEGIKETFESVKGWIGNIGDRLDGAIHNPLKMLVDVGKKILEGLLDGMKAGWEKAKDWLGGLNPTHWFNDINLPKGHAAKNMVPTGIAVMGGLQYGMQEGYKDVVSWVKTLNPADDMDNNIVKNMANILSDVSDQLGSMEDFNPVITPVLDLTQVTADAAKIGGIVQTSDKIKPTFSIGQARVIASTQNAPGDIPEVKGASATGPLMVQNNYSPTQLSTTDIYKQTRNQIRIAKEELSIS